ncbi:MAG: hypothetical protein IPG34_01700 [Rhodocyclaceae bacterium]|nr:hypothetical protein [Rhodocyclaceae bacterium]
MKNANCCHACERPAIPSSSSAPLADHAQLRALSAEVGSGKLDNLATFSEALIAHVRFEEREVFETAEEALGRDYLDAG